MPQFLFGRYLQRKAVDIATDNVRQYRQLRILSLNCTIDYLIGQYSLILKKINEASKDGLLELNINLMECQINSVNLNTVSVIYNNKEIDQLVVAVTTFLGNEGFNYTLISIATLGITWPDPDKTQIISTSNEDISLNNDTSLDEEQLGVTPMFTQTQSLTPLSK